VKSETKATRKRHHSRSAIDEDDFVDDLENQDLKVLTPKKRRKVSTLSTPQKRQSSSGALTPTSKRYVPYKIIVYFAY